MSTPHDWAQDYDVFDPEYAADPYPIWDELRDACPVAHTERYGSDRGDPGHVVVDLLPAGLPPIQADPPVHTWTRRLLLPWFSKDRVTAYEGYTRELCRTLLDGFAESGRVDAAADYAKHVPVRVIGKMLGIPAEVRILDGPLFVGERYDLRHTIVGISESRRTESFWTETAITPAGGGTTIATVLLHQGVSKDSFPDYPAKQRRMLRPDVLSVPRSGGTR